MLVTGDKRGMLRPVSRDAPQELANRFADQRRRRHAMDIGLREYGVAPGIAGASARAGLSVLLTSRHPTSEGATACCSG
jgi:hypothetical protein